MPTFKHTLLTLGLVGCISNVYATCEDDMAQAAEQAQAAEHKATAAAPKAEAAASEKHEADKALPHTPAMEAQKRLEAAKNFQTFFDDIQGRLFERDEMLDLAEVALLAKEHVLLMGPPGNAKSQLAKTVLAHMLEPQASDATKLVPSFYRIQMTPETTMSETHGPLDFKILTDTGRQERIYDQGMLMSRNVFIDEIFDARANANRNVLGLLNEREHAQGPNIVAGRIETVIAATNKYISEVYEKVNDDSPKALIDRFAFTIFVPKDLELTESYLKLIKMSKGAKTSLKPLHFADVDRLRIMTDEVQIPDYVAKVMTTLSRRIALETENMEQSSLKTYREKVKNGEETPPPYRATKYMSPRTVGKAAFILRAFVVQDWIRTGGKRDLVANAGDVKKLRDFFTLNGPTTEMVERQLKKSTNAHERVQLMAIAQEREIFDRNYAEIMSDVNRTTVKFDLVDLEMQMDGSLTSSEKEELGKKLVELLVKCEKLKGDTGLADELTGEEIGLDMVHSFAQDSLRRLLGTKYESEIVPMMAKIEADRIARIEQEREAEEKAAAAKRAEEGRVARLRAALEKRAQAFASVTPKTLIKLGTNNVGDKFIVSPDGKLYGYYDVTQSQLWLAKAGSTNWVYVDPTGAPGGLGEILKRTAGNPTELQLLDQDTIMVLIGQSMSIYSLASGEEIAGLNLPSATNHRVSPDGKTIWIFDPQRLSFSTYDWQSGANRKLGFSSKPVDSATQTILNHLKSNYATTLMHTDGKTAWVSSADGRYIAEKDLTSGEWKILQDTSSTYQRALTTGSSHLVFFRQDQNHYYVRHVNLLTGKFTDFTTDRKSTWTGVTSSQVDATGSMLFVTHPSYGTSVIDLVNQTVVVEGSFTEIAPYHLRLMPNGNLVMLGQPNNQITVSEISLQPEAE